MPIVTELVIAALLAVVVAVALVPVDTPIRRYWKRFFAVFRWWTVARQTGLVAVYPRTSEFAPKKLTELLDAANAKDDVSLIARTNVTVVTDFSEALFAALKRGATLRFLQLDTRSASVLGQRVLDSRAFGSHVSTDVLTRDAAAAMNALAALRQRCEEAKVPGRLLVFRTRTAVHNSAVILRGQDREPRRCQVLFDISFGKDRDQKFTHFYDERTSARTSTFIRRLAAFYDELYEAPSVFLPSLSYCNSNQALADVVSDRVAAILSANSDSELVRHNSTRTILPVAIRAIQCMTDRTTLPGPFSAQIELTNKCSTRCEHCDRWTAADDSHMNTDTAKALLNQLEVLGVRTVTLSGGEPTQHPDFAELLAFSRRARSNLRVGVLSNGIGITASCMQSILTHASWLRLSVDGVDGHTPGGYGAIRTPLNISADCLDLTAVLAHFSRHSAPDCKLAICFTIQGGNIAGVRGMIDWVRSLGLPMGDRHLVFKFAHGSGRFLCSKEQLEEALLSPDGLLQSAKYREAANLPYLRQLLSARLTVADIAEGHPTKQLYAQSPTRCFTPYMFVLVDPHGDVYPCCYLFEDNSAYNPGILEARKRKCMGHFDSNHSSSLREIWNGQRYQQLREELRVISPNAAFSACGRCTRHCNHNVALTEILDEYSGIQAVAGRRAADDAVLRHALGDEGDVWL